MNEIEMLKDWTGNKAATFATLAASNHSKSQREKRDFYATDPKALEILLDETEIKLDKNILEPSAGNGHLANVLKNRGYNVICRDVIQREYPLDDICDFLEINEKWGGRYCNEPAL